MYIDDLIDLQENNTMQIMQTLISHNTALKHKVALDQFRKGLNSLGLLSEFEKHPQKFEQFFVHDDNTSPAFVKKVLKCPDTSLDPVAQGAKMIIQIFYHLQMGVWLLQEA